MTGHTSNSAAVNDEMPALSSFRCSFNSAVSVTLVFCISSFDASEKGVGLGTYAFDGYVELLGDDGSQAACQLGHDGGLSVVDMFPQEKAEDGSTIFKGPNEAVTKPMWVGET